METKTETRVKADRTELDRLLKVAYGLLEQRNAIEFCCSPEWHKAHKKATEAFRAAHVERARLWKADRWGGWMNVNDKECARITGEL